MLAQRQFAVRPNGRTDEYPKGLKDIGININRQTNT